MMTAANSTTHPPQPRLWQDKVAPVLNRANTLLHKAADVLTPIADFLARYWVAGVFFSSGLTKTVSDSFTLFGFTFKYPLSLFPTETTFALFEYEYHVPLLPSMLAAYLGTAVELLLPVFLFLGLGTRYAAIALFFFNIVAVIAYPDLQAAGVAQHQVWGLLLLITLCHGPGKLSLDYLIDRWIHR